MLSIKNLTVKFGNHKVVDNVSFDVHEGQWLMIIGPNGAGKSTILNAITQGISYEGEVLLNDKDIKNIKPILRAKDIGILAQNHFVGYDFTVEEIVRLGRYAHASSIFSSKSNDDEFMVEEALKLTGIEHLRNQEVTTLSGGELQRTFLAQVFAQNPKILLLDEPTNHLDLVYQKQVFELINEWLKTPGRAVISVVHDLSLARSYGTEAILLNKGQTIIKGNIKDVFMPETLNRTYNMDVYSWMRQLLSQWNEEK